MINAHNSFQLELGFPLDPEMMFRVTPEGQADVSRLIGVGAILETNYSDRLHKVVWLEPVGVMGFKTHSLGCIDQVYGTNSYFNEYVAVDGRILQLFGNNDSEIIIHSGGQLNLF